MGTDAVNRSLWRTLKLSDKSEEKKSVGTTKPRTEKWVSSLWDKTATGFTEGGAGKHSVVCGCLLSLARGELPQPGRVPARRKRSTWGLSFVQLWAKSGKKLHCCKDPQGHCLHSLFDRNRKVKGHLQSHVHIGGGARARTLQAASYWEWVFAVDLRMTDLRVKNPGKESVPLGWVIIKE